MQLWALGQETDKVKGLHIFGICISKKPEDIQILSGSQASVQKDREALGFPV